MCASDGRRGSDDRIPILGGLRGEVSVFERMAVLEISRGGAQIETSVPLQLNSLHSLRLVLGNRSVVVRGRVTHSRLREVARGETVYVSGIEFVDVPDPVAGVITEFIEAAKTG